VSSVRCIRRVASIKYDRWVSEDRLQRESRNYSWLRLSLPLTLSFPTTRAECAARSRFHILMSAVAFPSFKHSAGL
jgi:hypothetical protein